MGLDAIESARFDGAVRATGVVRPTDAQRRGMVMGSEHARFFEAKELAVGEVLQFAAEQSDAEVALMGAYLATDRPEGREHPTHVAYCLREVTRVLAQRFDALTDAANDGADVREKIGREIIGAVDVLSAMRNLLASTEAPSSKPAPQSEPVALEGLAWVEEAEDFARFSGCSQLAVALLYLRGALVDGSSPALNLTDALATMTKDQATTLEAVLEGDGTPEAVRDHTGGEECERRARLLASGWTWLRTLAAK